jgi:phage host-nuclease inhibitor protein Gam
MIRNWSDFDSILRDIALIDVSVAKAAAARNQVMIEAETTYNTATAPLQAKRMALGAELELYYKAHRKDVESGGTRSIDLTFGRAGMRKGNPTLSCLKGWKWEKVLDAIQRRFARNSERLDQLVITKTSINKDGVKSAGFSEEELAAIGCKVKQADEFWYETFPEKAQERAA